VEVNIKNIDILDTDKPLRQRQGKEVNYSFEIFG